MYSWHFLRNSSRFASKTKIHPTDSQQEFQTEKSKETLTEERSITEKPSEILSETESTGIQSDAYIKSTDIIFLDTMDLNVLFEGCSKLKWFAVLNLLIFTFCFGISCWYLRGRLERDVSDFKFMISVAGMNIALDLEKIQELSAGDKNEDSSSNGEMLKLFDREF